MRKIAEKIGGGGGGVYLQKILISYLLIDLEY